MKTAEVDGNQYPQGKWYDIQQLGYHYHPALAFQNTSPFENHDVFGLKVLRGFGSTLPLAPFRHLQVGVWGDLGLGDPGMPDDTKIQRPRPEMTRFSFD